MRIRIKENAAQVAKNYGNSGMFTASKLDLEKLQGCIIPVETEYLFDDQYNVTVWINQKTGKVYKSPLTLGKFCGRPLPSMEHQYTKQGLRIMQEYVAEVIGDIRSEKAKCEWCGFQTSISVTACPKCSVPGDSHDRKVKYEQEKNIVFGMKPILSVPIMPDEPPASDYEVKAEEFLMAHDIHFKAEFKGSVCPMWCDGKHIHGDKYRISLRRKGKTFSTDFWNSFNDKENEKTPRPYDLLAAITKNDPGEFENFCSEFGYDVDSRKAEKIYEAVVKEWKQVEDFFSEDELTELQEIN